MHTKYMVGLAVLALLIAVCVPAFAQGPFADVPTDHWAYNAIDKLASAGLLEGYPDGTFKGQKALSRYEFAVAIARMLDYVDRTYAKAGAAVTPPPPPPPPPPPVPAAGLTDEQKALLERLRTEFLPELEQLRADVDDLTRRVEALEAVPPVELPKLKVGGDIRYRFGWYGSSLQLKSGKSTGYPFSMEPGVIPPSDSLKDAWKPNDFASLRTRIIFDGDMTDNLAVHVTLLAEPRNNLANLDSVWGSNSPNGQAINATGIMDTVSFDEAYAKIKTSYLLPVDWTIGKSYFGWGQGLLVDNDMQAIKAVILDTNVGPLQISVINGMLDREMLGGIGSLPVPPGSIQETSGMDNYVATRVVFPVGSWTLGGNWLANGRGHEAGWSADLNGSVFGRRLFAEYAWLTRNVTGLSLSKLDPEQNTALVAGVDLFDNSSFSFGAKWGRLQPLYVVNVEPTSLNAAGQIDGIDVSSPVINLPFTLMHPYAELSPDYINWVDRPLFLDPTNVAQGWELTFTWKRLLGSTMPLSIRWYGGDAFNGDYLEWLGAGGNRSGEPKPDKWAPADSAFVVSLSKALAENVDFTLLYGRRNADNILQTDPALPHDDLQVIRGELAVRF